tara:strand:+ start:442 stop:888 length:447 start_codon:yes stop_codon:yes gene_type:complete
MKITKRQLRRIIREEKRRLLEAFDVLGDLDKAVRAAVAEKGVDYVNDWLIGTAEEVRGGHYGANPSSGGDADPASDFGSVQAQILDAIKKSGIRYTEFMEDSGDFYIDTNESMYDEPWRKLQKAIEAMGHEVLEGDDGMVVEVDWDNL